MAKIIRKLVKFAIIAYLTNVVRKAVYGEAKKLVKKEAKKIITRKKK